MLKSMECKTYMMWKQYCKCVDDTFFYTAVQDNDDDNDYDEYDDEIQYSNHLNHEYFSSWHILHM